MARKLVLCDCLGSQNIDARAISDGCGLSCSKVYTSLCMNQIDQAAKELAQGDVIIACQQERPGFEELAADLDLAVPGFVDLRDRAGWGEGDTRPKMAALAAEAVLPLTNGKSVDVISEGTCLVIGGETALQAASELCDVLAVTVLLSDASLMPVDRRFDCVVGTIRSASGALGGFNVTFAELQQVMPGGRGAFELEVPVKNAVSGCNIILDLSGGTPMFPAPEKREGYLRADPSHAPSVAQAVLSASQMIGAFEKPLYVRLETSLCAPQPCRATCLFKLSECLSHGRHHIRWRTRGHRPDDLRRLRIVFSRLSIRRNRI